MARIYDPSPEQQAAWLAFVESRPPHVREVARKFFPWRLYRLKDSGHRVVLYSFEEGADGGVTLKVDVRGEFNAVLFERRVFGILPEDLEECDLPAPDEKLGAALDQQEAEQSMGFFRHLVNRSKR